MTHQLEYIERLVEEIKLVEETIDTTDRSVGDGDHVYGGYSGNNDVVRSRDESVSGSG